MKNKKQTGGHAFPMGDVYNGMKLRDYFASVAMKGLFSSPRQTTAGNNADGYAFLAYAIADAMIAERSKP